MLDSTTQQYPSILNEGERDIDLPGYIFIFSKAMSAATILINVSFDYSISFSAEARICSAYLRASNFNCSSAASMLLYTTKAGR